MQITKYDLLPEADLLSRLKRTRLRGFDRAEVYRDATLEIVETDPEALTPAQRYVLQEGVQAILDVADAFEPRGIDIFALRGALLFWPEGTDPDSDAPIPFLPPVIEESIERDGTKVLLINDGIHRVYAARKRGTEDQRGVSPQRAARVSLLRVCAAARLGSSGGARGTAGRLPEEGISQSGKLQGAVPRLQ